jgi:hypothetical protein
VTTNSFNLPSVSEFLRSAVFVFDGGKEVGERVREVEGRVQKMIEVKEDEIVKMAEELDVKQIVVSLEGDYGDLPLLYTFKDSKGNMRTVVSWYGYIKAARLQGNIKVEIVDITETDDKVIAKARAVDLKRNIEAMGVAVATKDRQRFAYEIAASKAMRNALRRVIDPDILAAVVKHARKMQSVKEIQLREVAVP